MSIYTESLHSGWGRGRARGEGAFKSLMLALQGIDMQAAVARTSNDLLL